MSNSTEDFNVLMNSDIDNKKSEIIKKGLLGSNNNRVPAITSPVQSHFFRSSLFKIVETKEINSERNVKKTLGETEYHINGFNLNIDIDFHLFIFILKRWEFNNRNHTRENFINRVNISFDDLRSNLKLSKGSDADALNKVRSSLNRLYETGITIINDNELVIEKLLKKVNGDVDVKQKSIYVLIPESIYKLYQIWNGVTFIDLNLLKTLSNQYSKALYVYLRSQSNIHLHPNIDRLKDVFGLNESLELTGNNEEDKIIKKKINQKEKNIKRAIAKAIVELEDIGFLVKGETVVSNMQRNYKFAVSKDLNQAALQELAEMLQNNNTTHKQQKNSANKVNSKKTSKENSLVNNSIVEGDSQSQNVSAETNNGERDKYGYLIISDKYSEINFERKKLNYLLAKLVVVENDIDHERLEYAKKLIKTPLIPDDFEFKNMDKNQLHLLIISKQIAQPFNDAIELGQYKLAKEIIQTSLDNPF